VPTATKVKIKPGSKTASSVSVLEVKSRQTAFRHRDPRTTAKEISPKRALFSGPSAPGRFRETATRPSRLDIAEG